MGNISIPVNRSYMPPFNEFMQEIESLWDARWLTNYGEKHQRFEENLKVFLDAPFINLYTNGHQALEAAFQIFPKGSEVITTPFTYASTTQAIVHSGLRPVFCDIEPDFYTIDSSAIEALITDRTVAIAAVHVYGNLCAHTTLRSIADKYCLKLIYDAAHAFGVTYNGQGIGAFGDLIMLSFHATKIFHTFEGGALICNDAKLAEKTKVWGHFGMHGNEDAEMIGTNAKMTEIQAAMGLCNLHHIEEILAQRKNCELHYRQRLQGLRGIYLCSEQKSVISNASYMPIRIVPNEYGKDRDTLAQIFEQNKILTRKYFYPLTSNFTAYQGLFPVQETPVAQKVAEQILCLPLYNGLQKEQINLICDIIEKNKYEY